MHHIASHWTVLCVVGETNVFQSFCSALQCALMLNSSVLPKFYGFLKTSLDLIAPHCIALDSIVCYWRKECFQKSLQCTPMRSNAHVLCITKISWISQKLIGSDCITLHRIGHYCVALEKIMFSKVSAVASNALQCSSPM